MPFLNYASPCSTFLARHDEAHGPSVQLVLMYELRLTADGRVEPNVALLPRVAKPGA